MIAGSVMAAGGMFWLSRITEHSHYASDLLGPMMVTGTGLGLIFVPLSLIALAKVASTDAGVASSLLNTGQQVGGALGLAVLGTVAWSAVANSLRSQAAAAAKTAACALPRPSRPRCRSQLRTTPWRPASPRDTSSRPGSCCSR